MTIAFIGLGNMGLAMARRLAEAGHDVVAFDTRGEALAQLGAPAAASPRHVADRAETVLASLPTPAVCLEVATEVGEGSRVKRYVDLSTVGSLTATQIHDLLAPRDIVAVDSPVSGGVGAGNALSYISSGECYYPDSRTMLALRAVNAPLPGKMQPRREDGLQ